MAELNNENQGYKLEVSLTVNDVHSIKPRTKGSFKNDEGEEVEYGYAVKFKSINVEEVEDKDFGVKEVESILEIAIACDTMQETVKLNNHLKAMKKVHKPFKVGIELPRRSGTESVANSSLNALDFMNLHKI